MPDLIDRKYYIGHPKGFPEVEDGQVLYDSLGNKLYIDFNGNRNLVNDKPEINSDTLDSSSTLPTSSVVKSALDSAKAEINQTIQNEKGTINQTIQAAESWKSEGNAEDVLSKDGQGNLNWIDMHNVLYWVKLKDPWQVIIENDNYATDYQIGKVVDLDFGSYGIHPMELIAIDADDKADGSGKARMTWLCVDIISEHNMNATDSNENGWVETEMRSWLRSDVWNNIPEILKENIIEVNKSYYDLSSSKTKIAVDTIWIPSKRELFSNSDENQGVSYSSNYTSGADRIKYYNGVVNTWWLRSSYKTSSLYFYVVNNSGSDSSSYASQAYGVVPGFCI